MDKLKLNYLSPQASKGYRYLSVPKELLENPVFSSLDYGAVILFAKMLERVGLSSQHEDKFTDENGRLFIIYTVEQMERDIRRSHPTVIKFTRQLADIGLIEKVRQGQGRPTKIYIKDFTSVESIVQEAPDFNVCKSEKLTPDSQESGLLDVKNLSSIELNHKDLENKDLPSYPPEDSCAVNKMTEEDVEELRSQIEYTVLCDNYGKDLADKVVEIITGTLCRDGPETKIGRTVFPTALVRKRMRSLTCEHVSCALDSLDRAGPVHNPPRYLLARLFNVSASCSAALQAVCNAKNENSRRVSL